MALDRLEVHAAGIRESLKLPGVRAELEARAERVADAANGATTTSGNKEPLRYEVRSEIGRARARAAVVATGARTTAHEHKHGTLTRVMDRAR